jgi:hypothetical protein
MRDPRSRQVPALVNRLARIAFTFLMMNYSAVAGAFSAVARKKVWR